MMRNPATGNLTVEELERWELFGARWRIVDIADDQVVIDLCTCDGQPVDRRVSGDADLISHVRSVTPD